jgi:hypothetical protein
MVDLKAVQLRALSRLSSEVRFSVARLAAECAA